MKLRELLLGCPVRSTTGNQDTEIDGIAYDSRQVSSGFLFVAIRGTREDGNRFISQAITKGAAAIVSRLPADFTTNVPWVQVDDDRAALAALAARYYGYPTARLHLIGITGTNGKTTTAYLVESILKAAGHPTAVLGTIEYRGPGFGQPAERTTPEAPDLEELLRRVVDAGWKYSVMEVSSHAIQMKRVEALCFEVAVFTNLSREHLDFHGDMRSYFAVKKRLFTGLAGGRPRLMVLNADDPHFEELRSIDPAGVLSYGVQNSADIRPLHKRFGWAGTETVYETPSGELLVYSSLLGTPNLYNIGAAIGVAVGLGIPMEAVGRGIRELASVPGRFELINSGQPFRVIVDYAHTDDALEKLLRTAREITSGKVIAVFGCGGERDPAKRPRMGEVAARWSDYIFITSDNPRSEDPERIVREIQGGLDRAGAAEGKQYRVSLDRRDAIRQALCEAQEGDVVVIAGKGHEPFQVIGNMTFPFDDRLVTRELLDELDIARN